MVRSFWEIHIFGCQRDCDFRVLKRDAGVSRSGATQQTSHSRSLLSRWNVSLLLANRRYQWALPQVFYVNIFLTKPLLFMRLLLLERANWSCCKWVKWCSFGFSFITWPETSKDTTTSKRDSSRTLMASSNGPFNCAQHFKRKWRWINLFQDFPTVSSRTVLTRTRCWPFVSSTKWERLWLVTVLLNRARWRRVMRTASHRKALHEDNCNDPRLARTALLM